MIIGSQIYILVIFCVFYNQGFSINIQVVHYNHEKLLCVFKIIVGLFDLLVISIFD
jgi:hypothetical protein